MPDNVDLNVITSKKVLEIQEKERLGLKLKKTERLWFEGKFGVRRANVVFAMTQQELDEYTNSKASIHYFSEHYCKVKLEDGKTDLIKLRPYQKKILDLYHKNRYSILLASRQIGKCTGFCTYVCLIKDNIVEEITIGELYYRELQKIRPLNIYEKIKLFLYKILKYLE